MGMGSILSFKEDLMGRASSSVLRVNNNNLMIHKTSTMKKTMKKKFSSLLNKSVT